MSIPLVLLALAVGCNEADESTPAGYLADTPIEWIALPSDDPGGEGVDWDEDETPTRPVHTASRNRFAQLQTHEGEVRYALTPHGGLTVSRPAGEPANIRFAAEPFHVSVEAGVAQVWTFERPIPGAVSRLEPVDARALALGHGAAMELPGTIQYVERNADTMLVVTVDDDVEGQSVTRVHMVDLDDPLVPTVAQSLVLQTDVVGSSGFRDFHLAGDRLYVATSVDRFSARLEVLAVDFEARTLALAGGTSIDGAFARGGIDETEDGVLRLIATDEDGRTELVALGDDLSEVARIELHAEDQVSWVFEAERLHFAVGNAVRTVLTTPEEVSLLPTPIDVPGRGGQLRLVTEGVALYERAVSNPGGGTHLAFSLVDFANLDAGEPIDVEGDWAFAGMPAYDDARQLFAVPIAQQWFQDPGVCPDTASTTGVQLFSRTDTALQKVAFIETDAEVESVEWVDGRLVVRTADRDLTFDVENPGAPALRSSVTTAVFADQLAATETAMARLHSDRSAQQTLELVPLSAPTRADAVGRLVLPSPTLPGWDPCESISHWVDGMSTRGDFVYVSRYLVNAGSGAGVRSISIVDASDPAAPALAFELNLPSYRYGLGFDFHDDPATDVLLVGDRLVVATYTAPAYEMGDDGRVPSEAAQIHVFDVVDPANPIELATFDRMPAMAHGKLVMRGARVVSWAAVAANEDASRMRVYGESFDVAGAPSRDEPQNLPGIPLAVDDDGDLLVVDLRVTDPGLSEPECVANEYAWNGAEGRCEATHEALAKVAVLEDTVSVVGQVALPGELEATTFHVSQERVFAVLGYGSDTQSITAIDWAPDAPRVSDAITLPGDSTAWIHTLAVGTRALVTWGGGYAVLEAADALAPEVTLHDRAAVGCVDLEVSDSGAGLCAGGQWGVEPLPLE